MLLHVKQTLHRLAASPSSTPGVRQNSAFAGFAQSAHQRGWVPPESHTDETLASVAVIQAGARRAVS
jgi:hypothetical protein